MGLTITGYNKILVDITSYDHAIPGIPNEIWQKIFSDLNLKEFIVLKLTCKQCYVSSPSAQFVKLWNATQAAQAAQAEQVKKITPLVQKSCIVSHISFHYGLFNRNRTLPM